MQERAAELNALGYSETDPTGIQQIEEGEEFDDITRQLRNKTNFNGGRYRIREAKDTGELAQINVRESSENRLSFERSQLSFGYLVLLLLLRLSTWSTILPWGTTASSSKATVKAIGGNILFHSPCSYSVSWFCTLVKLSRLFLISRLVLLARLRPPSSAPKKDSTGS